MMMNDEDIQISKSPNLCGSHQGLASLNARVPFSLSSQQIRNVDSLQKHYFLIAAHFHPLEDDHFAQKRCITDETISKIQKRIKASEHELSRIKKTFFTSWYKISHKHRQHGKKELYKRNKNNET